MKGSTLTTKMAVAKEQSTLEKLDLGFPLKVEQKRQVIDFKECRISGFADVGLIGCSA